MSDSNGQQAKVPFKDVLNERIAMEQLKMAQTINESGIGTKLAQVKKAFLQSVLNALPSITDEDPTPEGERRREADKIKLLLNHVGPAAASAAVEFAFANAKANGKLVKTYNSMDFVTNVKAILNDDAESGLPWWSNSLRQMLLPRYAYLDFDAMIDPRHRINFECGYPTFITPIMYRYMYDRDDVASRVNDIYPDECWAMKPCVYDTDDELAPESPFEEDWRLLCEKYNMLQMLYRMDKLCGIGHYGVLLLGIDDGKELDQPVDGIDPWGNYNPTFTQTGKRAEPHKLLYMRPFDEYLSFIQQYETNVNSPRYGLPVMYNLIFLDMTIDAAGASIGTRLNRRVHWTRVVHITDNLHSSLVYGIPRMQQVFNRLLDLRKIKGGSAEMLWKGGFPGIAFEVDPQFVADDPLFDRDEFKEAIRKYSDGLQRYIDLIGIKANTLQANIADNPGKYVEIHMQAIAMNKGVPHRIFLGSEEAKLASAQDKLTWNQRLQRKLNMFTEPYLIRKVIDRLRAMQIMRPALNNKYCVEWEDLNTPTDEDGANLALKYSQALSQYVSSGMIHLVGPMDYFTTILRLKPDIAKRLNDHLEQTGGLTKLQKVDPSQGSGVNGKRTAAADAGPSSGSDNSV